MLDVFPMVESNLTCKTHQLFFEFYNKNGTSNGGIQILNNIVTT